MVLRKLVGFKGWDDFFDAPGVDIVDRNQPDFVTPAQAGVHVEARLSSAVDPRPVGFADKCYVCMQSMQGDDDVF